MSFLSKGRWFGIAGAALVVGAAAWFAKIGVIVATAGRVTDTGAAAVFYLLGLALLFVGSTGLGLRLAANRAFALSVAAVVLSPVVFFVSFLVFDGIGRAIVGGSVPGYLLDEAGILLTAVAWLAVGATLLSAARGGAGRPGRSEGRGSTASAVTASPRRLTASIGRRNFDPGSFRARSSKPLTGPTPTSATRSGR